MNWKSPLAILCLAMIPFKGFSQPDTFSTYFPSGVAVLSTSQTISIDSFLYQGALAGNVPLAIIGYADEPGNPSLNREVAGKRALSVKAYLIASGIDSKQIRQCSGVGNLLRTGDDSRQRRVDVIPIAAEKAGTVATKAADTAVKVAADSVVARKKPKRSLKDLGRMKEDELMVIDNLLFKLSTAEFVKESIPVLNELVEVMKDFPRLKIRIEGHVCCFMNAPKESDKLKLGYRISINRAEAVKNYLEDHQISAGRLTFAGFGFSRPKVYPEVTLEDMSLNRRVEIRVISN